MSDAERFQIFCKECHEDVFLIEEEGEDIYRCPICNSNYSSESGVRDMLIAMDYLALYRGEVRAGLVPDPDFKEFPNG